MVKLYRLTEVHPRKKIVWGQRHPRRVGRYKQRQGEQGKVRQREDMHLMRTFSFCNFVVVASSPSKRHRNKFHRKRDARKHPTNSPISCLNVLIIKILGGRCQIFHFHGWHQLGFLDGRKQRGRCSRFGRARHKGVRSRGDSRQGNQRTRNLHF